MFPTFISILDIQSWWEVPSIAHFCSLFRTAFNLLDFDIEDLEEALLTDGTEETSWLQELIVRLLSGCLPNNEISTFNYQMFLRRLFRQKCQEHDRYNPFNTDCDFTLLPLRTKVDILHALCDFRLDAEDVLDQLKNLEADSLRVEPLGYDKNDSAYWYFYGTRLYREDFQKKNNKKKAVWQVICFTEDDWFQLTKKFKCSTVKNERALHHTLSKNFLPELPRLFKEKERQARRRLLENQPKRTSDRIRKSVDSETIDNKDSKKHLEEAKTNQEGEEQQKKKSQDNRRRESHERRSKQKISDEEEEDTSQSELLRHEMASKKRGKGRQRKVSTDSNNSGKEIIPLPKRKKTKAEESRVPAPAKPVGRQTNNSLSALDGQIVIQQQAPPVVSKKKKLKTSQVFQQTDEDLQVGMHKILDFVKNHEDAWPFLDPVEEEYAPNYYSIIRRPMDLTKMEDRLDQGYYKSFDKFKGDFQLIVNNCRLYNGAENEYTEMVDNLVKVFDRATEKYLDQISSSDEEIAVENLDAEKEDLRSLKKKRKRSESPVPSKTRKPALAAQGKKRENPSSEEEISEEENKEDEEPKLKKSKKESKHSSNKKTADKKSSKEIIKKKKAEKASKKSEKESKTSKKLLEVLENKESKKQSSKSKKTNKIKEEKKKPKKRGRKKKKASPTRSESFSSNSSISRSSSSRCPSPSPPRSILSTPPPSDVEDLEDKVNLKNKKSLFPWETAIEEPPPTLPLPSENKRTMIEELPPYSPMGFNFKPGKDKHNKLRETIEKLKAKSSEINRMQTPVYEFDGPDDHLKENKDKNKKIVNEGHKNSHKDNNKLIHHLNKTKKHDVVNISGNEDSKNSKKKEIRDSECVSLAAMTPKPISTTKQSNFEALSLATEQTLKDINKWLDDTPKFADFSSASNSPAYLALDDFDLQLAPPKLTPSINDSKKLAEKSTANVLSVSSPVQVSKKESSSSTATTPAPPASAPSKDSNKKKTSFRDPSKFFNKRREIQRTIDRLQPGKSKGNLISNVQNTTKTDEIFPLGPLSKIKDTKNSLIVKTDTNAPKLSLGSVLDSFGKHKFAVDDQKKEEENGKKIAKVEDLKKDEEPNKTEEVKMDDKNEDKEKAEKGETKIEQESKEPKMINEELTNSGGGPTPNLSAWFKAFGAPKPPPPQKKSEKSDAKEEESGGAKSESIPLGDPSPVGLESPQPISRQRRISTGSSMSERSSFSQDLDSPRVGMEERGAYPAPYPSPLHRSPSSGASPVTASPRADISPRSHPYPPFNGGPMRVGFYQDTVASSNKSSPDKSCSPRENHAPNSPYNSNYNNQPIAGIPEHHVYAPNTTPGGYSASYTANSPYYTHTMPSYSSTNPTPPYNLDGSSNAYYDTTKIVEQYQAKPSQNYTANSPAASISSSQASPAPQPQLSPHSPVVVHHSQSSPSIHSPSMHSPSLHSVHSSQHSHSPQQSLHSPGMTVVVSPQVNSPSNVTQNSPNMASVSSPINPSSVETFHTQPQQLDETSQHSVGNNNQNRVAENVLPMEIKETPSIFPVKKRAFLDSDMASQFEDIIANRSLQQLNHQQDTNREQLLQKQQQEQLLQKHHQQQLLQQQQKAQQLLQEQQKQQMLQEQKKLQEQQKQQMLQQQQQQKSLQLLQQQAMAAAFSKAADQSLRTPSPPVQQQQQQQQRAQQQVSDSSSLRSGNVTSYQSATTSQYASNFVAGRDAYASLNVPSAHQPKLDMSKFTNMGYSGPEVNFSRALQQQYSRPELNSYARTTVQSAISQASQLLNSQSSLITSQPSASSSSSLPGYQKTAVLTNQQQAHSATYQSGAAASSRTSVDSVAERLAAQAQQEAVAAAAAAVTGYKQDSRNSYNSTALDIEQALGLSRNLSNIVDRYSNEQRMMAGLQSASNPYYSDKGLSTSAHMFNKQLFSQSNMAAAMSGVYGQQQQQQQQQQQHSMQQQQQQVSTAQTQSLYGRHMAAGELQHDIKSAAAATSQDRKQRKKKSSNTAVKASTENNTSHASTVSGATSQGVANQSHAHQQQPHHAFQSYVGLKSSTSQASVTSSGASSALDALKNTSGVPGSAFNFGSGALSMPPESYPNLLDDFRGTSNYFMGGANAKTPGQSAAQGYHPPPFLNPAAAHQGRGAAYAPLGGPFMDTAGTQLYQHYLQAGVLNQGLLGAAAAAAGGYPPPTYHAAAALAMRQPYDSMSRPSWL